MARILTLIAAAAVSACMLATNIAFRVVHLVERLMPDLVSAQPFNHCNGHPRSILETRRAGLA